MGFVLSSVLASRRSLNQVSEVLKLGSMERCGAATELP